MDLDGRGSRRKPEEDTNAEEEDKDAHADRITTQWLRRQGDVADHDQVLDEAEEKKNMEKALPEVATSAVRLAGARPRRSMEKGCG